LGEPASQILKDTPTDRLTGYRPRAERIYFSLNGILVAFPGRNSPR